ncbi:MAG: hypothetical protein AAFX99_25750 [Myxococcota bacterium]
MAQKLTQEVGQWHQRTFPHADAHRIALRILREAVELARTAGNTEDNIRTAVAFELERFTPSDPLSSGVADVGIGLMALSHRPEPAIDLIASIRQRLEFNTQRDCTLTDTDFAAYRATRNRPNPEEEGSGG